VLECLSDLAPANIQQREGHFQGVLKIISLKISAIKNAIFDKKMVKNSDKNHKQSKMCIF
jgi:hypothetical protein